MKISTLMRDQIKGYETGAQMIGGKPHLLAHGQPALSAYQDYKGIWTIGWGHTGRSVYAGLTITLDIAEKLFSADIAVFEHGVETDLAGQPTTQGQFDAMVCFSFNVGLGAYGKSTMLKKHLAGDYAGAANEFGRWTDGGVTGEVARRAMEKGFYVKQ